MNQILVTEKIYVTPELRRKKKIYQILFILSIFLIIALFSMYIYAEYDRNREENISKSILAFIENNDDTTVSVDENALIVKLTQDATLNAEEYDDETTDNSQPAYLGTATSTYTASNGKEYEYIGRIVIPKIGVDYPILSETSVELLKVAPCKFHGGNPNEVGNLCIAGHNYRRKNRFFSDLDELVVGDIVEITDLSERTIQYEIYDIHSVVPEDRSDTTQVTNGKKEVTLITCTDDSKQRIIVKCTEKL